METNFQRVGAVSNTQVGNEFEEAVCLFFAETGTRSTSGAGLAPDAASPVGRRTH
jgi:hypothetical protein